MKNTIYFFFLSIVTTSYASTSAPEPVEIVITPCVITKSTTQIRLLPAKEQLTDSDSVSLYQKAIDLLPDDSQLTRFSEWRKQSPEQLPAVDVEAALNKLKPSLDLAQKAALSRFRNLPKTANSQVNQEVLDNLNKFRQLAFALDVQAKLQIAQGKHDRAIETIKTSLSMAKHLGRSATLNEGMFGIALGLMNINRIEQSIQSGQSPNFYWALKDINLPLVEVPQASRLELGNIQNYDIVDDNMQQKLVESTQKNLKQQMNYLDRKIEALQCIEALRLYASSHDNKFPDKLSDVTEVSIPKDFVAKKAFIYKRNGSEAVIESQDTVSSDGRYAVRYVLKLKN